MFYVLSSQFLKVLKNGEDFSRGMTPGVKHLQAIRCSQRPGLVLGVPRYRASQKANSKSIVTRWPTFPTHSQVRALHQQCWSIFSLNITTASWGEYDSYFHFQVKKTKAWNREVSSPQCLVSWGAEMQICALNRQPPAIAITKADNGGRWRSERLSLTRSGCHRLACDPWPFIRWYSASVSSSVKTGIKPSTLKAYWGNKWDKGCA